MAGAGADLTGPPNCRIENLAPEGSLKTAASADLKEAMEKAGVLDTPTIYFLESID